MSEDSIEERRDRAYADLSKIVDRLVALDAEETGIHRIATAHVLVIGNESIDKENPSPVSVCPAMGQQTYWKTVGLLRVAQNYYR